MPRETHPRKKPPIGLVVVVKDVDSEYHRMVRPAEPPAIPTDPEDVYIWIRVSIGPKSDERQEWFQMVYCTPRGLAAIRGWAPQPDYRPLFGHVLVERFTWDGASRILDDLCLRAGGGDDWEAIATRLGRVAWRESEENVAWTPQLHKPQNLNSGSV